MKTKVISILAVLLMAAMNIGAKVTLPAFFSSHMLLQQNSDCRIWGYASKGKSVSVKPSWQKKAVLRTASNAYPR